MAARALKTKITLNLTMLLLLGMASIYLVTMVTAQRNLMRLEVSKARAIAGLLSSHLSEGAIGDTMPPPLELRTKFAVTLKEAGADCLILLDRDGQRTSFSVGRCAPEETISAFIEQAMSTATEGVHFIGSTFGFLWMQPEYLVIAAPLRRDNKALAGLSLVFSLEGIYRNLRHSQQVLLLYIFFNSALLVFIGLYRISKLYLQPLARLAQRAEDYKEDEEILFTVRKEDNELQRLSSSLNGLLRRLSAEKQKLRATVASLETANAELKRAQTEIIRAEKLASVGRLSAGIAHEIGNPIGIVTGYLELLKHGDIPQDERIEFLDRAQQEIERISAIIRQLLEISRPSAGSCQPVSVHALIADMTAGLRLQPFMSHLRLQHAFQAQADTVTLDSNQLRQVFLNLIINAADAVSGKGPGSHGELVIVTENASHRDEDSGRIRSFVRIHFRDTGTGIAREHLESIFDPFFTTKEPGKGTGLGLAVSFMIVESAGGSLRAESTVGEGTIMTVSLPVADGFEAGEAPAGEHPLPGRTMTTALNAEIHGDGRWHPGPLTPCPQEPAPRSGRLPENGR
jgi:signal transduction histidine kinase